jgi:ABC-2 type transport system ATP-binding protein
MLQARDLTKTYASIPAVKDVTFSLESGQVLGCLGPNGSGKSTTVKMLIGLLEPTHGKVLFKGNDIRKDLVGFRKCLGYVPEEANLYPYLSGYEYLEMVAILRGMSRPQLNKKINNLLELLAMYPHRHAPIAAYSKGMRQRILLIAALMDDPQVLIFDEPLSGLDASTALVLKNLIRALGQQGKAIFYCSHVLEVVEQVCSHLLILRRGDVIASGKTEAIQTEAKHSTLERTFMDLVDEANADQLARDIMTVMETS